MLDTNYKRRACCAMNHGPIDSLLDIMANLSFKPEDIDELVILHNSHAPQIIGVIKEPETISDAQFSGYFNLAMTVVLGNNRFGNYTDETLKNKAIRELAERVRFRVDQEAEANYPQKRMGGIPVKLNDGTTYKAMTEYAKGMPQNPLTDQELQDKFREFFCIVLPEKQVDDIIAAVYRLDNLDDINTLAGMLCR